MTEPASPTVLAREARVGFRLGLIGAVAVFVVSSAVAFYNVRTLSVDSWWVSHSHEVLNVLVQIASSIKDAETGQRGYLITGDDRYLEPHTQAISRIDEQIAELERLTNDNSQQQARVPILKARVASRVNILKENADLRRRDGFEAARQGVLTDRGKTVMDSIREILAEMEGHERGLLFERTLEMDNAYQVAVLSIVLTGAAGIGLSIFAAQLLQRVALARQRQDWLLAGQTRLSAAMIGDQRLSQLGDVVVAFLARYLNAQAGVLYSRESGGFRRVSSFGLPAGGAPDWIAEGDSLLAQAAKEGKPQIIRNVPPGSLIFGSGLSRGTVGQLLIVPVGADGVTNGVLELGFVHPIEEAYTELFERTADSVGTAIRSAHYRASLQNLLEETQRQAEELQVQSEELRVSNEELEEQSRALKESQSRLEQQQAELEETNAQLEEQTQALESERDQLSRIKLALEDQARELERASQYKSDFLANMSHELRTPLNSSLILAKLLADNPEGNLTAEQIQYAETIRGAGNDLLALINDILDLSKIEAGHMELRPETVHLAGVLRDLERIFQPMAEQRGLKLRTEIAADCPGAIETDRQRLEQVLKNLLSNALKFTEQGEVSVRIDRAPQGVSFAVQDTGIGIPQHQHQMVFEAFRQADGTTNRRYGGTGLGLSISRELTRLLGGGIQLVSQPGAGSTFTVTIPEVYDPARVQQQPSPPPELPASQAAGRAITAPKTAAALATGGPRSKSPVTAGATPVPARRRFEDDRGRLNGNGRVILVVEDDEPFARILYDMAHELNFQCLLAESADEGVAVAIQYLPSAVVLDIGLPDHSGLSVLDRLKQDRRTRHIPVHVVSAGDYAQTALSLGAVGYMPKPVKREDLVNALKQLETRISQRVRRVLVVEDDEVQREGLRALLGSHDVETVGAGTAAECLERLRGATFDCMVLDLSLPDASGYSLLETLHREDAYSFPPVIVYTGRELSTDEEQRLRKYSRSIIIKGARSPERLLDEVTLFLHQVIADLPAEQQQMLEKARNRDAALEGRRILVVEDDVRNVFALGSILEPRGARIQIARNGREGLAALERAKGDPAAAIDLVLMDVMMPEMDGITATREIRRQPEWKKLPIIMLTAKAMKNDQEQCMAAGANDYIAKPLDVEKLLSLVRVWMPR